MSHYLLSLDAHAVMIDIKLIPYIMHTVWSCFVFVVLYHQGLCGYNYPWPSWICNDINSFFLFPRTSKISRDVLPSYQYQKSYFKYKVAIRWAYFHNGNFQTGKMVSLPLFTFQIANLWTFSNRDCSVIILKRFLEFDWEYLHTSCGYFRYNIEHPIKQGAHQIFIFYFPDFSMISPWYYRKFPWCVLYSSLKITLPTIHEPCIRR